MVAWYEGKLARILLSPYYLMIRFSKLFSRKRLNRLLREAIASYCRDGQTIINIGSGGDIRTVLLKEKLTFKEIDIDKKRKPDIICSMENMSVFKSNSVDVFFCMEVLEHVINPFKAVKEVKRVLKPGGVIIGSTPFLFPIHDDPHDYYRYTRYGLLQLFREFKMLKLVERNSYLESIFVVFIRLINTGTVRQRIIGLLFTPFFIVLLPFVFMLSWLVTNKRATTGYFFVYRKKGEST